MCRAPQGVILVSSRETHLVLCFSHKHTGLSNFQTHIHLLIPTSHLKPSGLLEMQEMATGEVKSDDNTVKPNQPYARWCTYMIEAAAKRGRPVNIGPHLIPYLNGAHFANMNESIFKIYLKPYPEDEFGKMIGAYTLVNVLSGIEGFTTRLFTGVLGWKPDEVTGFLEEVKKDLTDHTVHAYINL